MSPTKASLARFYPSLLPRAKSAEPPRPVSRQNHTSVGQPSIRTGGTNGIVRHIAGTASEGLDSWTNGVEKNKGLLATPRRRSQTPGGGNELAKQSQSVMNSGLPASPPEQGEYEETVVSATNGGQQEPVAEAIDIASAGVTVVPDSQNPQIPSSPKQRAPHVPTSGMGIGENGEPSLPSTPSQLGLEPPRERPKGPLFSSPTKRSRKRVRSAVKSSPLKPPDVPPEHSNQGPKPQVASLGPRRYIANTPKPPPLSEEARLLQMRNRLSDLEEQLQNIEDKLLRQLLVSSWQQDRSKDGKDIAKRRKEVVQRSIEIVHLRDEVLQIQAAQSIDHGQAGLETIDRTVASTTAPTLSQRLARYLPFAIKPRPPGKKPILPNNSSIDQAPDLVTLPTTEEPFTITTSDTVLLPSAVDENLLQRQDVTMSTAQQLLTCDFQLTANIATQQVSHLEVRALSSWAEPELGSWLRQSREKMELAALGKAFGRYWEVANLRGKCWISCKEDFKDIVANPSNPNDPLFYLGMQDLVFARSNVQLKVHWGISLSDQGEVESHSSAYPRFPPAWQQEANSELAKIGDAFLMLVEDRGIPEAIGTICKVVFPT